MSPEATANLMRELSTRAALGEAVIVHRCPTYFVEHRGWSQEVDIVHVELAENPAKRYKASGRRTPACPEFHKLEVHGATPDEAIENFRKHLTTCDWKDYFSGIMRRIDDLTLRHKQQEEKIADLEIDLKHHD